MSNKYPPNANFASKSHISNMDKYKKMYESSINDPSGFWEKAAERISWYESWNAVSNYDFVNGKIEWFLGGKLNPLSKVSGSTIKSTFIKFFNLL